MYDAFTYQHFGTYGGVVETVSQTMVTPQGIIGIVYINESTYRVSVALDQELVRLKRGQLHIQADMGLRADILLENKRVADWILDTG
ncbi:hypothetical protein [Asticcacaulis sp.]|uniref:hypothetical protein n=1 Tax=Asticcacaulis sp. TaxID=1872648 RepID=UPI00262D7B3C|nr:hypothetical protein [Asticcacaulis sp.]